ncbi:MAG: hypothetical protein WA880_16720 [Ornithinimicrobium sp.]
MSDDADPAEDLGLSERPRPRRSHRPATDGIAEEARELLTEKTDAADDDDVAKSETDTVLTRRSRSAGSDDWWQEQRPPHWG